MKLRSAYSYMLETVIALSDEGMGPTRIVKQLKKEFPKADTYPSNTAVGEWIKRFGNKEKRGKAKKDANCVDHVPVDVQTAIRQRYITSQVKIRMLKRWIESNYGLTLTAGQIKAITGKNAIDAVVKSVNNGVPVEVLGFRFDVKPGEPDFLMHAADHIAKETGVHQLGIDAVLHRYAGGQIGDVDLTRFAKQTSAQQADVIPIATRDEIEAMAA